MCQYLKKNCFTTQREFQLWIFMLIFAKSAENRIFFFSTYFEYCLTPANKRVCKVIFIETKSSDRNTHLCVLSFAFKQEEETKNTKLINECSESLLNLSLPFNWFIKNRVRTMIIWFFPSQPISKQKRLKNTQN